MRKIIFSLIVASSLFPSAVFADEYALSLSFSHILQPDSLKFIGIHLEQGRANVSPVQPKDGYTLRLLSSADKELFTTKFTVPIEIIGGPKTGDAPIENEFFLNIPYLSDSKKIEITDPREKRALTIDVPSEDNLIEQIVDKAIEFKTNPPKITLPSADVSAQITPEAAAQQQNAPATQEQPTIQENTVRRQAAPLSPFQFILFGGIVAIVIGILFALWFFFLRKQ